MLGSLDPSKRKICVTVFLDELFEELSEDYDSTAGESNSVVHVGDERAQEGEKSSLGSNDNVRKPRAQSKFGKSTESYSQERKVTKCECCGGNRSKLEDSKTSLEVEFPEIVRCMPVMRNLSNGCRVEKVDQETDCPSGVMSESVMTDDSYLSTCRSYTKKVDQEVDCSSHPLTVTKSTQFDYSDLNVTESEKSTSIFQISVTKQAEERRKLKAMPENQKTEKSTGSTSTDTDVLIVEGSSEQITNMSPEEVIRIWSTCKKVWNEGYESEMSEIDCVTIKDDTSNRQLTVLVETDMDSTSEGNKTKHCVTQLVIPPKSDTKCHRSRYSTQDPKPHRSDLEEQVKDRMFVEKTGKLPKNYAEGDTFEEPPPKQFVLKFDSNEKTLIRKHPSRSEGISEVYKKDHENSEVESVTVFADNPHDENTHIITTVFDLEDSESATKCLRRMKTVEIVADGSMDELNSLNTEVILYCDSLSRVVSVEAWEEGSRNLVEARELCLRDSRDSSVYLIEIPVQFVKSSKNKEPVAIRT